MLRLILFQVKLGQHEPWKKNSNVSKLCGKDLDSSEWVICR